MKNIPIPVRIQIHPTQISLQPAGQPELLFSSDLPVRRQLRDPGYSEKGWLWCAFQEALVQANIDLHDPMQTFKEIWKQVKPS